MGEQLFLVSQACEVVADHLVSALRGFAVSPQANQHASNDRAVALDLDTVAMVADEVATAQHVFEEAKRRSQSSSDSGKSKRLLQREHP